MDLEDGGGPLVARDTTVDFYHASEHLWNLGRAYVRGDEGAAQAWVEPRLHQLRHGQEETVLAEIAA